VNADSGGKANSSCRLAEWRSAWGGMFSTDEPTVCPPQCNAAHETKGHA
jgi:hypothetical protein